MARGDSRVQHTIRLPESLYDRLAAVAKSENRSINNQIEIFVEKGVENHEKKRKKKIKL